MDSLLLLLLALSVVFAQLPPMFNNGRFYYESLELDGGFYVARPFRAVYTSPFSSVSWVLPSACSYSAVDSSNANILVTCSLAGLYSMQVYHDGQSALVDTFFVRIASSSICYVWYLYTGSQHFLPPNSSSRNGTVWVIDPLYASVAELQSLASIPSTASKQLTNVLHNVGEKPDLSSLDGRITVVSTTFDDRQSAWVLTFNTGIVGAAPIILSGRKVSMLGCLTTDLSKTLVVSDINMQTTPFPAFISPPPSLSLLLPLPTLSSSTYFRLRSDVCSLNVQLAISSYFGASFALFSEDGFQKNVTPLKILNTDIKDAVIVPRTGTLGILSTTGSVYLINSKTMLKSITLPTITHIRTSTSCDTSSPLLSYFVAWRQVSGNNEFFLYTNLSTSTNSLPDTFTSITVDLGSTSGTPSGYIHDIAFQQGSSSILVLIRRNDDTDQVMIYTPRLGPLAAAGVYKGGTWKSGALILRGSGTIPPLNGFVNSAKPKLCPSASNSGELYLYGDNLLYSPDNGISIFSVTLQSKDSLRPAVNLATNEYITSVVTSYDNQLLALTSSNRVFYGRSGLALAVEITAGISTNQLAIVGFDALNNTYVRSLNNTSPYVTTRYLPLSNELITENKFFPSQRVQPCPFSQYQSTFPNEVFLDIDTNATYTVSAISDASDSLSISMQMTDPDLLVTDITSSRYMITDSANSATFTRSINVRAASYLYPGTTSVNLAIDRSTFQCSQGMQTSIVRASCPPGRRLILHRTTSDKFTDCSDTSIPTTISISAGKWIDWQTQTTGSDAKTVAFNCSRFGPPLYAYYNYPVVPTFDLYDGTQFVKNVSADMVFFEINGRTTFSYNTTELQAGCTRNAQSWSTLVAQRNGTSPYESWTPSNYKKCYPSFTNTKGSSTTQEFTDKSNPYQVVSTSNFNRITWSGGEQGLYVFRAKVIDPSYSFCILETEFAIYVYGAPLSAGIQIAIVLSIIFGTLLILLVSYWWYRKQKTKEKEL